MANKDDVGGGSGLSDEEWAEFEKQFTKEATKTAAYKEPSARQRELTAKWKKEAPKDTGWRTDGPHTPLTPGTGRPNLTVLPGGKRKRAWRRNLAWATLAAIITGLLIGGPKLFSTSKRSNSAVPPGPVASTDATPPANQSSPTAGRTAPGNVQVIVPSLDPSRAAVVDKPWPAIDARTAFPAAVQAPNGQSLKLVTIVATTTGTRCTDQMSQPLADLVRKGSGCQQLAEGLYTDAGHKTQYTVAVLTMKRAEDAAAIMGMAKMAGLDYQVYSVDPPASSGIPVIPEGAPGYTDEVMTVRSVVFVMGQYSDGGDHDADYVSRNAQAALEAVDTKVVDYETSR